jgi:hypothetical protein
MQCQERLWSSRLVSCREIRALRAAVGVRSCGGLGAHAPWAAATGVSPWHAAGSSQAGGAGALGGRPVWGRVRHFPGPVANPLPSRKSMLPKRLRRVRRASSPLRHSHGRPQLSAPAPRPEIVPRAAARCSRRHSPKRCPRRRRSARNSSRIVGNTLRRLQATPAAGIASAPCVSSRPPGRAGGFPGRPRSRSGSCAAGRRRCSPGRDRPVGPISGGDAVERLLACRAS